MLSEILQTAEIEKNKMGIAEKFYRKWFRVAPEAKLTSEQMKTVRMMHECLREYNKPKLPVGTMLTNKANLADRLRHVKECLNATDKLMAKPEYSDFSKSKGGSELAKIWNNLNLTLQSVMHFEMKIPLERLTEEITDELIEL